MKQKHLEAYMDTAIRFSKCSTANRLQVGCIAVKDNKIIQYFKNINKKSIVNHLKFLSIDDNFFDHNKKHKYMNNPNINSEKWEISYVIYTSGTTGQPKGVLIKNESVSNLVEFQKDNLKNNFSDKIIKVLFFSSFVFDAHVWELISGLLLGNQLYLVDDEARKDYNLLAKFIDDNNINLAVLPPVMLNKERILNLDVLFVAGDKTNSLIVKEYLNENKVVYNAYGPTENTVMCFMHKYTNFLESNCIGSLVYNHKAYILDNNLQPLPDGAIGELYLTGVGLCAGYLNRDSLNQEKFLKNPFQSENEKKQNINVKIYKTGDLVRRLSNGKIEYIGRNDFQVKISGIRIELEEIENTILSIKEIKKVHIIIKDIDKNSLNYNKTIICYYTSDNSINNTEIVDYLQKVLPHFMIPKFFILLDEFPLNNSGKIDLKLLPNPEIKESINIVTPRNSIEQKLRTIWAEVLGLNISFIGIHSDFFSLGGDSIKAIQTVSRIRNVYKLTLNVKDILNLRTIENISNYIELQLNKKASANYLPNLEAVSGEYPLLPIQKWFFANNFAHSEHWNHYFLIITNVLDLEKLKQSINKLINIHDVFKISFKKNNNNWIQVYKDKIINTDLKILNIKNIINFEESIDFNKELLNILKNWQNNFDLEHGPLYSFGYIYGFNNNTARIFVAVHHLLVDTISWKIIQNDLFNLYYNNETLLKRTSYLKWAEKIKNYSSENFNEKKYWDNVLINFKLINNCFTNYLLTNTSSDVNYCTVELEISETNLILDKVNSVFNTTVPDLLISVMVSALYNITHGKEHFIMIEGNGRNEVDSTYDILDTIGWFSNMFPVKLEVKKNFAEQICYVKDYFKKVPNNGIGYGAFYSYSSSVCPKILFNYFGIIKQNKEIYSDLDNNWSIIQENSGLSFYSSKFKDFYICCNSLIFNSKLYVYFEGQIKKNYLNNFASLFKKYLIEYINEIAKYNRKYLTLSDVDFCISQNYLKSIQFENEIDYILPTTYTPSTKFLPP
jgi:amino acid adenylation domain-containing protein/non-ribosomal peptide synthase protein (TIGR01720 family)